MNYKRERLGTKLLRAARAEERYRDVHVFIGGTGAVGGTALLQMLSMYEEMMSIQPPEPDDVPILVTTGRKTYMLLRRGCFDLWNRVMGCRNVLSP
jgi:hypothetical protein